MKPLNQAERRKAFTSFLLFFLITVGVVVIAVFSSMQVPFQDNKKLKKEKADNDKEMNVLIEFERKLDRTTRLLDTFHLSRNRFQTEAEINKNLEELAALANINTTGIVHAAASKMVYNLTNLYNAKKDLRDQSDKTAALEEKDREIALLKAERDHAVERYLNLANSR